MIDPFNSGRGVRFGGSGGLQEGLGRKIASGFTDIIIISRLHTYFYNMIAAHCGGTALLQLPSIAPSWHGCSGRVGWRAYLVVLLVSLQIWGVRGDSSNCYKINSSASGKYCTICLYSSAIACQETAPSKPPKYFYSRSQCVNECCNPALFDDTQNYSICNGSDEITSSSTLSLSTILIIIFFSIPAAICLLIAICTCVNNNRRTQDPADEPGLSAVNIGEFNLDDLGPLYQDRTQACSICLENDCNLRTRCGHQYHSQCLRAWIQKRQKCPLCVSANFNPLILYCAHCFKQVRMVVLGDRMTAAEVEEWESCGDQKCQECVQNRLEDVISLDFSEEEPQPREPAQQQEPANDPEKINSRAEVAQET